MTIEKIGNLITQRREFLNLRQEDLAEMSGVAIKTIHLIESGLGNPSVGTLEKVATILGLELLLKIREIS
jgi:transcriptional regulator with XRE-family HTH domain